MSTPIRLYYWADAPNFGDALSAAVVSWLADRPVEHAPKTQPGKLLGIGSILQSALDGDVVFGSGAHPVGYEGFWRGWKNAGAKPTVLAVRGPLSRDLLLARDIACPPVFGDPAILLPRFYKPRSRRGQYKIGLVPHLADGEKFKHFPRSDEVKVIKVWHAWQDVVDEIHACERIISSSLHGLIVAESLGIPATWFRASPHEGYIKYADYYAASNRIPTPAYSIADALAHPGEPLADLDDLADGLRKAFDIDLIVEKCAGALPERKPAGSAAPSAAGGGVSREPMIRLLSPGFSADPVPPDGVLPLDRQAHYQVRPAEQVVTLASQPWRYREEWPFQKGAYTARPVTLSVLPQGFQVTLGGRANRIANARGQLIMETYSRSVQKDIDALKKDKREFETRLAKDEIYYIDQTCVSISNNATQNYFHFLLQSIPSIYAASLYGLTKEATLLANPLSPWQREAIAILCGPEQGIYETTSRLLRARTLIRPSPANFMDLNARITPFSVEALKRLEALAFPDEDEPRATRLVYVSRKDAGQRRLLNEDVLEACLEDLGFEIFVPSAYDLKGQMAVMRSARVIVGTHGAGLTNIAFAPRDAAVFEIFPGHYMDGGTLAITQILGQSYRNWTAPTEVPKEERGDHREWWLDMEAFKRGFVGEIEDALSGVPA